MTSAGPAGKDVAGVLIHHFVGGVVEVMVTGVADGFSVEPVLLSSIAFPKRRKSRQVKRRTMLKIESILLLQ